ncbi:MAG TPA: protein kinase [Kofleriaceae bacterium]
MAILDHVRRLASGTASEPLVLATPPLLRASLLLAIRHAVQAEPYSAFEQASGGAYHDSSWCTWSARPWDARWVASTIASLRATGRNTSIASIARTVALPPRTVERTLATLDATLALSGGVPIPIDDLAVPGYSLRELLGHGAQGSVYRATRERDGTEVALKIVPLRPDTEREPEVMARFHSIRILQVHARGVIASAGAAWFETELCTGSIDDALAETGEPLAVERACRYALQALEGLEYLHDRDFVHRDIKPANLLRRKNDSIVIADLGLTGQFEDHSDVIDGRAGGTARFAPREQLLDAHAASPASDVWSLAATLYFMLTLELPRDEFGGQSELVAARDNPIVSIAERRDDLPGPLVGVIDRALSIDIAQRPRNGREFRRALQAVVEPTEVRRRRALVIGVGGSDGEGGGDAGGTGDGLDSASYNDARRVAQVLRARGFEVDLRLAGQATRAEILDGLDHLIAASSAEDAAVIYYAGFGFLVMSAAAREVVVSGIKTAGSWQAGAAWHGITDRELSLKLTQLTARTRNATLILDCCLAPQMSRDAAIRDLRVRALRPRSLEPALAQHLADLRAQYGDAVEETACGGNPNVVVIAACGPNESAYYQRAGDGSFHGVFTMALLEVLETRADATTSWRALIPPISARCPTQRPRITGPAHRTPFSLVEVDDASRAGVAGNGATSPIAIAGAGWPVALDLPADVRPLLVHQIAEHPGLRVAEPGELGVLATLRLRDGALSLEDAWGPLYPAARVPDDVDTVLDQVATLGIAQSLRDLEQGVFADELDIELGIVAHGEELPLPGHGAALGLGDRVYLKIANRSHRRLFAHVFNIGLQGTIALLTRAAPSGVELAPGGPPFVLGQLPGGRLEGLHLSWPDGLPRTNFPRLDEIIVIITRTALDLTVFEIRPSIARRPGDPRLHDLLSSLHDGRDRARANDELGDHSFYLKRLSFLLHPQDAALGRVRFQVDENPSSQAAASDPDAWISRGIDRVAQRPAAPSDAPGAIAIRLADLIIEDAGALESSEIRLDALICTRAEEPQLGFVTCTDRWSRIANGARLYDRLLYRAAVRDFVDLVLFVSRDSRGSASLAQLFAQRSTSVAFQDAVSALRITRDEIAVPWVTAVGASAVLTHMAFELLTGVAGKTLGLYRTSFGQRDRFSVGRHPSDGMYRARGFSFSLIIEPAAIDPARR